MAGAASGILEAARSRTTAWEASEGARRLLVRQARLNSGMAAAGQAVSRGLYPVKRNQKVGIEAEPEELVPEESSDRKPGKPATTPSCPRPTPNGRCYRKERLYTVVNYWAGAARPAPQASRVITRPLAN